MKTRSNMPLFVLEVSDVKALSNSQIDLLRCGDWLVKKDASGEHPYHVTFKKEGVGMCLTYHDASVIETQSYDWNNSLKKWVYNSEDKSDLPVGGDLHLSGDLEVDGDAKLFENIVDADGHKRFIEGNITTSEITGLSFSYAKWSLSGTHLMLVVAGTIAPNTSVVSQTLATVDNLPEWIYNKLVIIYALIVAKENMPFYTQGGVVTTEPIALRKQNNNLDFLNSGTITNTGDDAKGFRFTFDFLIDNE